jgi:putative ABC transport system permease protein
MGASLIMLTVATVGVAAATFGPVFLQGSDQSVLHDSLLSAVPGNVGLTLLAGNDHVTPRQLHHAAALVPLTPTGQPVYTAMIVTESAEVETVTVGTQQGYSADLVARTGMCQHLAFIAGSCPQGAAELALSNRSAHDLHLGVGGYIALAVPADHDTATFEVAGLFRPGNALAPIWWGQNYFGFGDPGPSPSRPRLDDFVTTMGALQAVPTPGRSPLLGQLPLNPSALTAQSVDTYVGLLDRYEQTAPAALHVDASTQIAHVVHGAATDEHTMTGIVAVVLVQLVLLTLIVLYFVATRLAESREPDVRLAELRGFTLAGRASVALFEPLAILALALFVGFLVAWLAGRALAHDLFAGATPEINALAIWAALGTFAAGALATILAARGLLRRQPQWRGPSGSAAGNRSLALAVDALAVALAVAAFVELAIAGVASGTHTDPLAALAPGLLALALGIIGGRLLPWGSAAGVRVTRNTRWIGAGMATRRLSRLHTLSRHVVVLTIAIGLAVFAVTGWAVAGRNRSARGAFDVGASTVLSVAVQPGVNFITAVRRADPSGHHAMAVVVEHASDGITLAVDARRLAAVAAWPASLSTSSVATIARALDRSKAPPVELSGSAIRVTADVLQTVSPPPMLQATVFNTGYDSDATINFGALESGSHQYQSSDAGGCAPSCQLVDLSVTWTPPDTSPGKTAHIRMQVESIATQSGAGPWKDVPAQLARPADWQSATGGIALFRSPPGLGVRAVVYADGSPSSFGPADVPRALPVAIVGPPSNGVGDLGVGLDGETITTKPVASVSALPEVGTGASMVDLSLAQRVETGPMLNTQAQVWLSQGPTQGVIHRLKALGIQTVGTATAVGATAALAHDGISLAFDFFLLAAMVAALLAVGSTIFVLIVVARRRQDEFESLRAVGVGVHALRRSLLAEQGLIILIGVVLGTTAGIASALVALPSIPEFVSSAAAPLPDFRLSLGPVALTLAVVGASLAVATYLSARILVNRSSPDRLGGH